MGAAASRDGLPRLSEGTLAELARLPEAAQAELARAAQSRLPAANTAVPEEGTPAPTAAAPAATAEELAAQYTKPAALLAALRDGDVQLLSARWLMGRAGFFRGNRGSRSTWTCSITSNCFCVLISGRAR